MSEQDAVKIAMDWMDRAHKEHMEALDQSMGLAEELGRQIRHERRRTNEQAVIICGQRRIIWCLIILILWIVFLFN